MSAHTTSNLVIALTSQMIDGLHILEVEQRAKQIENNARHLGVFLEGRYYSNEKRYRNIIIRYEMEENMKLA